MSTTLLNTIILYTTLWLFLCAVCTFTLPVLTTLFFKEQPWVSLRRVLTKPASVTYLCRGYWRTALHALHPSTHVPGQTAPMYVRPMHTVIMPMECDSQAITLPTK